ncbi:unnamed protein product [Mucor hiemalis]
MSSDNLAVASSVSFPYQHELRSRRVNILPGAWIEEDEEEELQQEQVFKKTVSPYPPQISLLLEQQQPKGEDNTIELLKQTIDKLRVEKEKLEETNDIVKKSIQVVARKRIIAQTQTQQKKSLLKEEETDEEDVYIIVPNDFVPPTHDEMIAAGLDGWEWITAY